MAPSKRAVAIPPFVDDAADQNNATRLTASAVPSITGLRLKPHGASAKLVNISTTGMLTECPSRLKVGSTVAVLFEGSFPVESIVGRIARCEVSATGRDGALQYHVAIAFNQPLALDALSPSAPAHIAAERAPVNPLDAPDPIAALAAASAPAPAPVRNRW